MKREELKKLGIEDEEVVDQIMAAHGKDIEKYKSDLEAKDSEVVNLSEQLSKASEAIEGFKEMDIEAVQAAADEWKEKAEKAQKEAAEQVKKLQFDHALEKSLQAAKAKNPKAVRALLKVEELELNEEGELAGFEDQIKEVKAENDYLFESDKPKPKIVDGGENKNVMGDSAVNAARKGAGLPNH